LVKGAKPYLNTVIDRNDPYPRWDFNEEGTRDIFMNIVDGTQNYPGMSIIRGKLVELFKTNPKDTWIQQSINRIKSTKIDPIISYINSKGHGGDVAILGFNNCLNPKNLSNEFYDLIQEEKQKQRQKRTISPITISPVPPPSPSTIVETPALSLESRPSSPMSIFGLGRKRKTIRKRNRNKKTRKIRRHK
jgi:hypothetical protein